MNVNYAYKQVLTAVLMGSESAPRNMPIKEMLCYTSVVDMTFPAVTCAERKISPKFLYAEAAWILSGDNKVSTIEKYNRNISPYSDDGIRYYGAYGPKVMEQMSYVVQKLIQDPDSRQAVISIWRENPPQTKDVPCTLTLQFIIRGGFLHCVATMRSSDAWLGWVYDVFNFSMIARAIVIEMKQRDPSTSHIRVGRLFLTAGSQHLYEKHWAIAEETIKGEMTNEIPDYINDVEFESVEHFTECLWVAADLCKANVR